jgi:hypothetical protein
VAELDELLDGGELEEELEDEELEAVVELEEPDGDVDEDDPADEDEGVGPVGVPSAVQAAENAPAAATAPPDSNNRNCRRAARR